MKKGFTLVEMLAVLGVISVIMVLVIPNISTSSNKSKTKMYQTKEESILKAYKMCTDDDNDTSKCNTPKNLIINGYLLTDDLKSTCDSNCIKDPRDNTYLDDCIVNESTITC